MGKGEGGSESLLAFIKQALFRDGGSSDGSGHSMQPGHQILELLKCERLCTIFQGFIGVGMHFNEESIGTSSDRGQGHGSDKIAATGALTGIGDDRQV